MRGRLLSGAGGGSESRRVGVQQQGVAGLVEQARGRGSRGGEAEFDRCRPSHPDAGCDRSGAWLSEWLRSAGPRRSDVRRRGVDAG